MARILIVDDTNIMKHFLQSIVEKAGHEVVGTASNGKEAVKLCGQLKPDLVTMDILMGEHDDGLDALMDIKKENPFVKVIMVTMLDWIKKKEEAQRLGADGYITKPFASKKVRDEIESVMGKRKRRIKD